MMGAPAKLWEQIAAKPATITFTARFAADEWERLQKLAEHRGCSVETVLRTMAATCIVDEGTPPRPWA